MAKKIVAQVGDARLSLDSADSDRLVYANYYVPTRLVFSDGRTPILPFYVKQRFIESIQGNGLNLDTALAHLSEHGWGEVWTLNEMESAMQNLQASSQDGPAAQDPDSVIRHQSALADASAEREHVIGLLKSQIGFVFLDRTRITPAGFRLGEHIFAMGLAPGEVVALEQKTFTKRQVTMEDQTDQEKQFDLELSSTYSTEIQEDLERQQSRTDASGWNFSQSVGYTSPTTEYGTITGTTTLGASGNVNEANDQSYRRSVKDSQQASGRVAARYRTQHKTTFRVVTETGFEATQKRTIQNPNRTRPITLHCFKVMQRLEMKQERYGVRLCWAVSVRNPGTAFAYKIAAARKKLVDDAIAALPAKPTEPPAPPAEEPVPAARESKAVSSGFKQADKWNAAGGQSADYDVDVDVPQGWAWNETASDITITLNTKRTVVSNWVVGTPYVTDTGEVRVRVHIGTGEWFLGPGIEFQVTITVLKEQTVTTQAAKDTTYNDALIDYRVRLKEWEDHRATELGTAHTAGAALEARMRAALNPVDEVISQIVDTHFAPGIRDEMWEVDYWHTLFDWERASLATYASWWSTEEGVATSADPLLAPSDFMNASWAKLYLPVRVDFERSALRWIFGKAIEQRMSADVEVAFDQIQADLQDYRKKLFGNAQEAAPFATGTPCLALKEVVHCIAKWEDLLPTDGTHLEAILASTGAADEITESEISDADALRKALVKAEDRKVRISDKAETMMTEPASVSVVVGDAEPPQ